MQTVVTNYNNAFFNSQSNNFQSASDITDTDLVAFDQFMTMLSKANTLDSNILSQADTANIKTAFSNIVTAMNNNPAKITEANRNVLTNMLDNLTSAGVSDAVSNFAVQTFASNLVSSMDTSFTSDMAALRDISNIRALTKMLDSVRKLQQLKGLDVSSIATQVSNLMNGIASNNANIFTGSTIQDSTQQLSSMMQLNLAFNSFAGVSGIDTGAYKSMLTQQISSLRTELESMQASGALQEMIADQIKCWLLHWPVCNCIF